MSGEQVERRDPASRDRRSDVYSAWVTLRKAVIAAALVAAAIAAVKIPDEMRAEKAVPVSVDPGAPATEGAPAAAESPAGSELVNWLNGLMVLLAFLYKVGQNVSSEWPKIRAQLWPPEPALPADAVRPKPPLSIGCHWAAVALAASLLMLAGCASTGKTKYSEKINTVDPKTGEVLVNEWTAEAHSKAGLFGQVPEGVHDIHMKSGGPDGTELDVGQRMKLDNTAQADVAIAYGQIAGQMMGSLMSGFFSDPAFLSAMLQAKVKNDPSARDALLKALAESLKPTK